MQPMPWSLSQIKQCRNRVGQGVLSDEHSLVFYSQDFSHLRQQVPSAVAIPQEISQLQQLVSFAQENSLGVTIRGNGLSQSGQSLTYDGGMILSMERFNQLKEKTSQTVWAEANATWRDVISAALKSKQVPFVLPYNCNLSIAGVVSAGGVGASSFRQGSIVANINALEVVTASGELLKVDKNSPLFHACLGGQGRFAIITKAEINLRPCKSQVSTYYLLYNDRSKWQHDLLSLQESADYIESFCTPAIQGAKLTEKGRIPFAEWFYAIHASFEYDEKSISVAELKKITAADKIIYSQEESIESYLFRHDSRFQAMKMSGQWDLQHVWYECFLAESVLFNRLDEVLKELPLFYATIVQVVPVQKKTQTGFFMLPESDEAIYAVMILNPGLPQSLIPAAISTISKLDGLFLPQGGKRYLSGYLGSEVSQNFWQSHFGEFYEKWCAAKKIWDEKGVFYSKLYQ